MNSETEVSNEAGGQKDINQMTSHTIGAITRDLTGRVTGERKESVAVSLGRSTGLKGGKALAERLSDRRMR